MRKEIRYLIGTRQIFWATVKALHFKKYSIVLGEVNLNNTIVEHMNIFPHSFRINKNFTTFRKNIKIGDKIKLEGRVSYYNKIEDGKEIEDYCLRDINLMNVNPVAKKEIKKRIGAKAVPCPNCGKEKIIEIFENDDTKEENIICKCGKEYNIKYKLINGKINVDVNKVVFRMKYFTPHEPFFNGIRNNILQES